MATALKRPSATPPPASPSPVHPVLRAFDAVFRFLASLKLAVLCLLTLAAALGVGTWVESRYGTAAVQEWVYQSWWFAVLLAFLSTNILCAALIRFPWTKRQTGFVITHAGLLTVLAGAFISFQAADEGQVAILEGSTSDELIRPDHPMIRVREIDPHTRKPTDNSEYRFPFRPGSQPWDVGRYEVLSDKSTPFKLAIKNHLTASLGKYLHEPAGAGEGMPMVKLGLFLKNPRMVREMNVFADDLSEADSWFVPNNRGYRSARSIGPALVAFQYLDSDDKLDAFLHPPEKVEGQGVATFRYVDRAGKTRRYDWPLDQEPKTRTLPDSDLTVTFDQVKEIPSMGAFDSMTGEGEVHFAQFKVRKGDGPEVTHAGWASLPMLPSVFPDAEHREAKDRVELAHVDYLRPLAPGRLGSVEVVGMPDGRLFFRSRNAKGFKPPVPMEKGKKVAALGGEGSPMSLTVAVEQFLPSGKERLAYEQIALEVGKMNQGLPAALVELTDAKGEAKDVWLQRPGGFAPRFHTVLFRDGKAYELAYDVDRKPLGFSVTLDDFEFGLDPGTQEPSSFRSDVRLTDEAKGIKDKKIAISMNNTMSHRGWTFYQSNYDPVRDPETNRKTGEFWSIFQVGYDPGRPLKYLGCGLVFFGAIVQFYMRAGIFTDGGKLEKARADRKAARRAGKDQAKAGPAPAEPVEPADDVDTL